MYLFSQYQKYGDHLAIFEIFCSQHLFYESIKLKLRSFSYFTPSAVHLVKVVFLDSNACIRGSRKHTHLKWKMDAILSLNEVKNAGNVW